MSESIHLIIIGAGLAGLSAGISTKIANPNHRVTILESVKELAEIGVGPHPTLTSQTPNLKTSTGWAAINTQRNTTFQALGNLRAPRTEGHLSKDPLSPPL